MDYQTNQTAPVQPGGPGAPAWGYPPPQAPPYGGQAPVYVSQPPVYPYAPPAYMPPAYAPYAMPHQAYQYAPPFAAGGPAPKDPRRKGASQTLNRMCLLVLGQTAAAFLWQFLIGILLGLSGAGAFLLLEDNMALSWMTAALVPLSTALPFFLYMLIARKDTADYLKFQKVGFGWGLLCVIAGAGICLLGNYPAFMIQDLLQDVGYSSLDSNVSTGDTWASFALEFFSLAVLVPFMEEFVFRGVLLSSLRKYGVGFSIVASAIVFGLVHLQLGNIVFATIAGLVMGFLYARTNNLWLTIAVHAVNNGLAVIGSYSGMFFANVKGDSDLIATACFMLAPIGLGLVSLVFVLIFRRRIFPAPGSPHYEAPALPLTGGQAVAAVLRAPMFWAVVAMIAGWTIFLFL